MRSFSILATLLVSFSLTGCGEQTTTATTAEITEVVFNAGNAPTVGFSVPSIHCENCAGTVCETLKEVPGVVDVKVDVESKTATVAIDEANFDSETLINALAEAAFADSTELATAVETVANPLEVVGEEAEATPAAEKVEEAAPVE